MPVEVFAQLPEVSQGSGYAVGWFTLALLNAGLAQSKRRSGLLWFVASMFFGPIATFLLVVCFADRPGPDPTPSDRMP